MENILYIGPYREFSGMGNASRNYIKALIQTGHNICVRPIYNVFKAYPETEMDSEIISLESNFSKKYHKVIQHCYPHQLCYSSKFDQNIGIVHLESTNYNGALSSYINIMDTIIVGSKFVKSVLLESQDIKAKINVIPEPIDTKLYQTYINSNPKTTKQNSKYSFYVVSDFIQRKNINLVLLAFLILSDKYDDIELVIKTKSATASSPLMEQTINYEFEKIYNITRKNYFKKPQVLVGDIKHDGIKYIHHNNNCLINISSGESFGYSVLEAMFFNNNTIVTNNTALSELTNNTGYVVDSDSVPCFDNDRLYHMYNTLDQKWQQPILNNLVSQMSKAIYESKTSKEQRIEQQKSIIETSFTTEKVAEKLSSIL